MNSIPLFYYKQGCFKSGERYPYSTHLSLKVLMKLIEEKYLCITLRQILRIFQVIISYTKDNLPSFGQVAINLDNIMIKCNPPFGLSFIQQQTYQIEIAGKQTSSIIDDHNTFYEYNQSQIKKAFSAFFVQMIPEYVKQQIISISKMIQDWDTKGQLNTRIDQLEYIIADISFQAQQTDFSKIIDEYKTQQYTEFKVSPFNDFILIQQFNFFLSEGRKPDIQSVNQLQAIFSQICIQEEYIPELQGFLKQTILEYQSSAIEDEKITIDDVDIKKQNQLILQALIKKLENLNNQSGIQHLFLIICKKQRDRGIIAILKNFYQDADKLIFNYLVHSNQEQPLSSVNTKIFREQLTITHQINSEKDLENIIKYIHQNIKLQEDYKQQFQNYNNKILQLIQVINEINDRSYYRYFQDNIDQITEKINQLKDIIKSKVFNFQLSLGDCKAQIDYWQFEIQSSEQLIQQSLENQAILDFKFFYFNFDDQFIRMGVHVKSINDLIILKSMKDILHSVGQFKFDVTLVELSIQIKEIQQIAKLLPQLSILNDFMLKYENKFIMTFLKRCNQIVDNHEYQKNIIDYIQEELTQISKTAYLYIFSDYIDKQKGKSQGAVYIINQFKIIRFELFLNQLLDAQPQYSYEIVATFYSRFEQRLQQETANDKTELQNVLQKIYHELCELQVIMDRTRLPEIYFKDYRSMPTTWVDAFTRHDNPQWADYLIDKDGQFLVSSLNTLVLDDRIDHYYFNQRMAKNIVLNYDKHMVTFFKRGIDLQKHQRIWNEVISSGEFTIQCYKKLEDFKTFV